MPTPHPIRYKIFEAPCLVMIAVIFLGVVFLGIGINDDLTNRQFRLHSVSTVGTVTDIGRNIKAHFYRPNVTFTSTEGNVVTFQSPDNFTEELEEGKTVTVRYLPHHLETARLDNALHSQYTFLAYAVLGITLILTGLLVLRRLMHGFVPVSR